MSLPVVGVAAYENPDGCNTVEGNVTVADPVVDTNIFTVCPGLILLGLICVSVPGTNCKVKKLPLFKSNEAVFEDIVKVDTLPTIDPVVVTEPDIFNEPVTV
jgi:hypothetical protein